MTTLNKQTLINLLIDSPLREAIKINLIDIVNNTADADLEKTYSTISKELEIYQKATERRLKLAAETIAQLSGTAPAVPQAEPAGQSGALPPLPPMPQMPVEVPKAPAITTDAAPLTPPPLQVPPLDLPPFPSAAPLAEPAGQSGVAPVSVVPQPVVETPKASEDDAALQEIQKELDALKSSATSDATPTPAPTPIA